MDAIEKFEVGNLTVEIHYDDDPTNPRTECDNPDTMVCFHGKYNLGDKEHGYRKEDFNSWDELENQIIKDHNPIVIKPLYLYDHSGITISTGDFCDRWDSGQVGFIFFGRKQALDCYMVKRITKSVREKCNKEVDTSVRVYDTYLRGECYGFVIKDEDDEVLDSCWGFDGEIDYCKGEATKMAEELNKKPKAEKEDPNQMKLELGA